MNIKKLDDKDIVFLDKPWTSEDLELFRKILKIKKNKAIAKSARSNKLNDGKLNLLQN